MCMTYYLGCQRDAPLTAAYSTTSPVFYVSEPQVVDVAAVLATVRQHLPFPIIRCLGSHTGCGCGFRNDGFGVVSMNPEDIAARQADHEALAAYLRALPQQSLQIYICWAGDEAVPPEHFRTCSIAELASPDFIFHERELITLSA